MDKFTKVDSRAFGPFVGNHQGLLSCIKTVFKDIFKEFFLDFFATKQNYVNAELDKTDMLFM